MSEAPPCGAPEAALVGNIRSTLATTLKVLEHLEQSLRQAGFPEGRDAYRKMADTVLGQALWIGARGDSGPLKGDLAAVAQRARAIHALLHPYAEAMMRLGAVDTLDPSGAETAPSDAADAPLSPPPPEDPVLGILARTGRPMSLTALRAELRWEKETLTARIGALEKEGHIRRRSSGGRELYALTADE